MGTCWPEKQSTNRERLINELVQGQESAHQLQILLQKPYDDGCLISSADELLMKILRSFNQSLSELVCTESGAEVCQNLASSQVVDSAACYDHDRRSEDSGESKKIPAAKDKRGRYKRKKTTQSWTTVSSTIEDGHAWRKYGQKEILNAKYPRSYFRCTRKFDQGCKATKQVQRMEDENSEILYRTTYIGHHTCVDMLKAPQIITDSDPWESYTYIISSSSKIPSNNEQGHHPFTSLSTPTMVKQEPVEDTPSDLTDNNKKDNNNVSSLDSIMWKDIMPFDEDPVAADEADTMMGCDYGVVDSAHQVYSSSCTEVTSQSLDMDFVVKSIDFDCDFPFDEGEFNFSRLE